MKMHPKYLSITFTSNSSVKYDMYSRSAGHSPNVHFLICMLDNEPPTECNATELRMGEQKLTKIS